MSEEDKQIQKATVKTVASRDLEEQVQKELEIPDPDLDKAKALLGVEDKPNGN